jgi:hypothetical protein
MTRRMLELQTVVERHFQTLRPCPEAAMERRDYSRVRAHLALHCDLVPHSVDECPCTFISTLTRDLWRPMLLLHRSIMMCW